MCISRSHTLARTLFSIIFIILESGLCLFPSTSYAAGGAPRFALSPTAAASSPIDDFSLRGAPGSTVQSSVRVTNSGTAPGSANLYALDGITAQTSGVSFPLQRGTEHDVGAWIVLSRHQVRLAPGQYADIPFLMYIPRHVRDGEHGGGIILQPVQTRKKPANKAQVIAVQFTIVERIAIGVLVTLPGQLAARLSSSGVTYGGMQPYQQLLVHLQNTGNMMIHPSGRLRVWDWKEELQQDIPLQLSTIMPQDSIAYPVYVRDKALLPGAYRALLEMDYEQHRHLSLTTRFLVPPPARDQTPAPLKLVSPVVAAAFTFSPWYYVIVGAIFLCPLVGGLILRRRKQMQAKKQK